MRRIILIAVSVFVLLGGLFYAQSVHAPVAVDAHQVRIVLGDTSVTADIADTEALREQGLSGREPLTDEQGMLFVFPTDGTHSFWMKDMKFAIDMIWLSSEKRVVYIAANATPESFPASFTPTSPARYVLEVPAGWAARHGVATSSVAAF